MTFTVSQLCERWQCSQKPVLKAIAEGRLQAFQLTPGAKRPSWRIPEDAVTAFERSNAAPDQIPTRPRRRRSAGVKEFF